MARCIERHFKGSIKIKYMLHETGEGQYVSGKAQVMFTRETETMFSSAQDKKLNMSDSIAQ